jgi:VanZ family protein
MRRSVLDGPLPFVVMLLASLVLLFAPGSATPSTLPPGVDKIVHLTMFAGLAWTGRRAGLPVAGLAVGLAVYAAGSEVLQAVLPLRRDAEVLDAVVDLVGVALGLVAARRSVRA